MAGMLSREFVGFGPNPFDPGASPRFHQVIGKLRRQVREACPSCPGVYGMLDGHGDLIYVGKAKRLRTRLLGYFRAKSSRDKSRRVLSRAAAIVWEHAPSEFAALLRELQLIRQWRPALNVAGMPRGRQFRYVCLGRPPAPYAYLAREPNRNVLAHFGPVPAGWHAREAVRRINDVFRLRDCPKKQAMAFADEIELFPEPRQAGCMRVELGACLGPCAAMCSRLEYGRQVRLARRFLEGADDSILVWLRQQMEAAAKAERFEQATALRNTLEPLDWLRARLAYLRAAEERLSFVYVLPTGVRPAAGLSEAGHKVWYLIQRGTVANAFAAPTNPIRAAAVAAAIQHVYALQGSVTAKLHESSDQLLLVSSWFRKFPQEQKRTLMPAEALECCRLAGATPSIEAEAG